MLKFIEDTLLGLIIAIAIVFVGFLYYPTLQRSLNEGHCEQYRVECFVTGEMFRHYNSPKEQFALLFEMIGGDHEGREVTFGGY